MVRGTALWLRPARRVDGTFGFPLSRPAGTTDRRLLPVLSRPLFSGCNIDTPKALRSLAQRCSRSGLRWVRRTLLRTYPGRVAQGRCPPVPANSFTDVSLIAFEAVLRPGDIHAVTTPPKLSSPNLTGSCNLTRTSIHGESPSPRSDDPLFEHGGSRSGRQPIVESQIRDIRNVLDEPMC